MPKRHPLVELFTVPELPPDEKPPPGLIYPAHARLIQSRIAKRNRKTSVTSEALMQALYSYVVEKRRLHGLTQAQMAQIAGISTRHIQRLLSSKDWLGKLPLGDMVRIFALFGDHKKLMRVLGGTGRRKPNES